MESKEKELFQNLCKLNEKCFDKELLTFATDRVLGQLFLNRMQGVAYQVLKQNNYTDKLNREFRNSLKSAYNYNVERNKSFYAAIEYISKILKGVDCKYAFLKGAILCNVFPEGCRTSNDIDILVSPSDVTVIGKVLSKNGFVQGYMRNERFIPATRKEIIESKMLRGETVPYIKPIKLSCMKYIEIDINYSLDYKNNNSDVLDDMLNRSTVISVNGLEIPTLERIDFFIHLCCHLYKEATTLPWIEMRRDMTLYKYFDIYMLICDIENEEINAIFNRAKQYNIDKICAYVIKNTLDLFGLNFDEANKLSNEAIANDMDFLNRVISPKDKKLFKYKTKDIQKRFFMNNRDLDLYEVKNYEKT